MTREEATLLVAALAAGRSSGTEEDFGRLREAARAYVESCVAPLRLYKDVESIVTRPGGWRVRLFDGSVAGGRVDLCVHEDGLRWSVRGVGGKVFYEGEVEDAFYAYCAVLGRVPR